MKQAISSIKFSRLANSDIKNAIYPLVFLYKGNFCWKRKKMYDIGGMLLYSLIYVIRGGQTSKLEDVILNCERSEPIHPLTCFIWAKTIKEAVYQNTELVALVFRLLKMLCLCFLYLHYEGQLVIKTFIYLALFLKL